MAETIAVAFDADRPKTFSEIVGSDSVVRRVTAMLSRNQMPKVVFFSGPTGSGKTTIARVVARAMLCKSRNNGQFEPCGNCENCRKPINDSTCSIAEYHEYDSNCVTEDTLEELGLTFLRPWEIIFFDELQDMKPNVLKRLRKLLEGATSTVILTTSHPDQIEDAVKNRLKSYEYQMTRPTVEQTADYLERQCKRRCIRFESRSQLIRVANALNCEMRPCGEFTRKVLAEAGSQLTDEYLDEIFGSREPSAVTQVPRRRNLI